MKTFAPGKVKKQTKKTRRTFLDDMDALAYGVEAWFEENTGYSKRVTERTLDLARKLGIPEDEIERWAAFRLMCGREKVSVLKHLIEETEESFAAKLTKEGMTLPGV